MKQSKTADKDTSLPDALNVLYAQFEQKASSKVMPAPTAPDIPVPLVTAEDVRAVFLGVNPKKATGIDSVHGRALRSYVDQLVEVFTDIFNLSLLQAQVPTCFKKTTTIPDATSLVLHSSLEHLENKDTYIRLLLIAYSPAFNTIIP
eukprot:g45031.t1